MSIKDMVKNRNVDFMYYKDKEFWYQTEDGFDFPVPLDDVGTSILKTKDKAIYFMRWIRKHLEILKSWEDEKDATTEKE